MATDNRLNEIREARPFEEAGPWKVVDTDQTRPFRPNKAYKNQAAGIVVLVCLKSRTGNDFAVSADALDFFPAREADPASWVKESYLMLVEGERDKPSEIRVIDVMPMSVARDSVRDKTPIKGSGGFGAYYWIQPLSDDVPM